MGKSNESKADIHHPELPPETVPWSGSHMHKLKNFLSPGLLLHLSHRTLDQAEPEPRTSAFKAVSRNLFLKPGRAHLGQSLPSLHGISWQFLQVQVQRRRTPLQRNGVPRLNIIDGETVVKSLQNKQEAKHVHKVKTKYGLR